MEYPNLPINIPAIPGPIILAALNTAEFKAMAFIKSFFPTKSMIKDCLAGMSIVFKNH